LAADEDLDPAELWPAFYLADRGFPPTALAPLDLVRIAPLRLVWPAWWPKWWARTFRLVVRAYEADGTPASLHARAVPMFRSGGTGPVCEACAKADGPDRAPLLGPDAKGRAACPTCSWRPKRKTTWPKGYEAAELLFADPGGLALLRGETPENIRGVLVCEGLTDLAAAAMAVARERLPLAVLGATSGGFVTLARVRWPDGLRFYDGMDPDPPGRKYAAEARAALHPRPLLPLAEQAKDLNNA